MQIAICDDEKNIRKLIGDKVKSQFPEAEIDFYSSGDELLLSDIRCSKQIVGVYIKEMF